MVRALTQTVRGEGLSPSQNYILFTLRLFMGNILFNNEERILVTLHPDSQIYTTTSLPRSRCVWTRLPMGLVVCSNEFQKKLDAVHSGKPGVTGIADDMIITGKSEEEHNCNFLNFLHITRNNHLRLNGEKLQFQLKEVLFIGHSLSSDGLGPDPKKIKPLLQMQMPEDKETIPGYAQFSRQALQQVF